MAEIVEFPKPEPRVWVCGCGCATFFLHDDGIAHCAICDTVAAASFGGGWAGGLAGGPEWTGDPPLVDVCGNGDPDFERLRLVQLATDPEAVCLIVIRDSGSVTVWTPAGVAGKASRVRGGLRQAASMLRHRLRGPRAPRAPEGGL